MPPPTAQACLVPNAQGPTRNPVLKPNERLRINYGPYHWHIVAREGDFIVLKGKTSVRTIVEPNGKVYENIDLVVEAGDEGCRLSVTPVLMSFQGGSEHESQPVEQAA